MKTHLLKLFGSIFLAAFISGFASLIPSANAGVTLPALFGDNMVFQQNQPLIIWGWTEPNETVTVTLDSASAQARANERGEWKVALPAMKAGGPFKLKVAGSGAVVFDNVMIGEVWLCSGQSNMEMGVKLIQNASNEIAEANDPNLRLMLVTRAWAATPQTNIDGQWKPCSPETIQQGGWKGFSAAAYFFGRQLRRELGVPVGLIESSWGGTRIESWTPPEGFAAVPALHQEYESLQVADPTNAAHQERLAKALDATAEWLKAAQKAMRDRASVPPPPAFPAELCGPHDLQNPTALYNGIIHPLIPFPMRGVIWYQGEANLGDGMRYTDKMRALIFGWRGLWGEGDFPFYYVQIAPYNFPRNPRTEAEMWEAQAAALSIPNTGMAVTIDIGDLKGHPRNKQEVGRRLALLALAKTYGRENLVCSGPTFQAMSIEDGKLRVKFDNVGGGLVTRDGKPPDWFEIIDANQGDFVKADATIDGAAVVLSASAVKHPVAMRFAWSMLAEPNLMNREGLPAGAFRAGALPKRDSSNIVP